MKDAHISQPRLANMGVTSEDYSMLRLCLRRNRQCTLHACQSVAGEGTEEGVYTRRRRGKGYSRRFPAGNHLRVGDDMGQVLRLKAFALTGLRCILEHCIDDGIAIDQDPVVVKVG